MPLPSNMPKPLKSFTPPPPSAPKPPVTLVARPLSTPKPRSPTTPKPRQPSTPNLLKTPAPRPPSTPMSIRMFIPTPTPKLKTSAPLPVSTVKPPVTLTPRMPSCPKPASEPISCTGLKPLLIPKGTSSVAPAGSSRLPSYDKAPRPPLTARRTPLGKAPPAKKPRPPPCPRLPSKTHLSRPDSIAASALTKTGGAQDSADARGSAAAAAVKWLSRRRWMHAWNLTVVLIRREAVVSTARPWTEGSPGYWHMMVATTGSGPVTNQRRTPTQLGQEA
ncbi:hypothetical protein Esi_0290_0033 [Ectocarpus siliculosus]|uniref:Uncharacterized protein n=1 Tax=Ectocarpus siliculosus TaxID=2880 RepID=D7FVH5_ECTSI|nr:hypothetical protein Esi_0290_0033 [Ectocarpus siliculosus]|eukprot:CBJ31896.1 hypothetical protein Esi_0290_0033 [Ectocarpus siliculosus]